MTLGTIERNYGCYAEYCRSQEEDYMREESHMWEEMYEEDYEEEPATFEVGESYCVVGIYGGITYYTVKEINADRTEILLAEHWVDVDGEGEREAEWHKLVNEGGSERALEYTSKTYGECWINARD